MEYLLLLLLLLSLNRYSSTASFLFLFNFSEYKRVMRKTNSSQKQKRRLLLLLAIATARRRMTEPLLAKWSQSTQKTQSYLCIQILFPSWPFASLVLFLHTPTRLLNLCLFLAFFCSSKFICPERSFFSSLIFSLQNSCRKQSKTPRVYVFSIRSPTRSSTTTRNTNISSSPPLP